MSQQTDLFMSSKRICILVEAQINRMLRSEQLTAAQGYLLLYIWEYHPQGIFVTDVHRELGISMAAASSLLKKLREKGFLQLEDSRQPDDRLKKIRLTEKLFDNAPYLQKIFYQAQERAYNVLSPEEQAMLYRLQKRILDQILQDGGKEACGCANHHPAAQAI